MKRTCLVILFLSTLPFLAISIEAYGFEKNADKLNNSDQVAARQGRGQGGRNAPGGASGPRQGAVDAPDIDISMTIHEAADRLKVSPKTFAHELELDISVDMDVPLSSLGVDQRRLRRAVNHTLAEKRSGVIDLKYPVYLLICLFSVWYLLRGGIPKGADPKKRKGYYPQGVYIAVLVLSVIVLGFILGKSPNPMEGAVKLFKAHVGLYDSIWPKALALAFFLALAVIANKVVCGWACPFGALEELIYTLPIFKKIKRKRVPFLVSNSIRIAIFILFLLAIYGYLGERKGFVLYHYLNPFNLFNRDFGTWTAPIVIIIYLTVSTFFYRPFCQFICPFGLLSWIAERLSLARIRIDLDRCTDCKACSKACPTSAAADRLDKKLLPADCFSCMRCLRVCPADAINYRPAWGLPSPPGKNKAPSIAESE